MNDSTLLLLKEKIIQTDSVIKLISEKNGRLDQLREKLKFLYRKYLEKTKEVELCKLEHEPLTIDYKNLLEKFNELEEDYRNIVNNSEIKYQRICQELEESRKKSNEAQSDKCEKCQEGLVKNRLLKKEITSLKQQVKRLSQNSVPKTDLDLKVLKQCHEMEINNLKAEHTLKLKSVKTALKTEINDYQNKLISLEAHELILNEKIKELTLRLDNANQLVTKKEDAEGTLFRLLSECAVAELPKKIDKRLYTDTSTFGEDIDDCQSIPSDANASQDESTDKQLQECSLDFKGIMSSEDKKIKESDKCGPAEPHQNSNKINVISQVILSTPRSDCASNEYHDEPSQKVLNRDLPVIKVENVEMIKSDESDTLDIWKPLEVILSTPRSDCSSNEYHDEPSQKVLYRDLPVITVENVEMIKSDESDTIDIWKCIQEMKTYPHLLSPFSNYESDVEPNDVNNQNNSSKAVDIDTRLNTKRCALKRRKTFINSIKKDLFHSIVKYINRLVCKGKRNSLKSETAAKTKKLSHKFRSMRKVQMLRWKELRELWLSNTDSEQDTSRTQIKKIRRRKYREKLEQEYLANKEHYGKLSANFHNITEFYNLLNSGENVKLDLKENIAGRDTPDESCLSSLDSGFGDNDNKKDEKEQLVQKTKIGFIDSEKVKQNQNSKQIKSIQISKIEENQIEQFDNTIIDLNEETNKILVKVAQDPIGIIQDLSTKDSFTDNFSNIKEDRIGKTEEDNRNDTEKRQKCTEGNISGIETFVTNESVSIERYQNQVVEKVEDNAQHDEYNEKIFVAEKQNEIEIKAKIEEIENAGEGFSKKENDKIFDNTRKLDASEKQEEKQDNFIIEPTVKTSQSSVEIKETISTQLNNLRFAIKVEDKNEIDNEQQHVTHEMSPEKLFTAERQHEEGYKESCKFTKDENKALNEIEEKQEPKYSVSSQETNQIVQRTTTCVDQNVIFSQDNDISYPQDVSKTLPTESIEKVPSVSLRSFQNLRYPRKCKNSESKIKNPSVKAVESNVEQTKSESLTDEISILIVEDDEFSKSRNLEPPSEITEESFVSSVETNLRKAHCPKQRIDTVEKKKQTSLSTIITRSKRKLKNNIAEKCNKNDNNSDVEGNKYEKIDPPAKKQKLEDNQCSNSKDIEMIKRKINIQIEATKKPEKTTFKRPNRRKIQLESPVSPPHVTECDDLSIVSTIIPLEPIGELHQGAAKRLLKKLLQFPDESTILQEVFEKFSDQKQEYVIRLILEEVALDQSTPDTLYTPPAPVMTVVQRVLLGLLARLQETFPCLFEDILAAIEHWILTQATLQSIQPVTRLYIALCKVQKVRYRMRRMMCDVFYSLEDLAVPFLFTVLGTWIDILPLEAESSDNPLVKVLIQVINMKTCTKPGYNLIPLKKLLEGYYGYPTERWNSEEVFKDIFENFKKTPTKYIEYCLLILCKNHPKKWVCQQIANHVKPILDTTCKNNPIFSLLKNILPMLAGDNSTYVQELKSWLQELPP